MFDVKSTKRAFATEEINKLLKITKGRNIGLVIRLTYYTGMRLGEISGLTWNHVHLGNDPFLFIPEQLSKSGKPRNIPLAEKAFSIVMLLKEKLEKKKKRILLFMKTDLLRKLTCTKKSGAGENIVKGAFKICFVKR